MREDRRLDNKDKGHPEVPEVVFSEQSKDNDSESNQAENQGSEKTTDETD